jgi:hypothetical protein
MKLGGCYSGLSASDDSWFVYTNGSAVCNKNNDTLVNGFDLSPGGDDNWRILGMPIIGMATIIFPLKIIIAFFIFYMRML